jgi:hypothetical protein
MFVKIFPGNRRVGGVVHEHSNNSNKWNRLKFLNIT